jgi:hypothetical protein
VMTYSKLYDRLLNDGPFAEQLGYIVGKSKLHKDGKGLFDYRAAGMSLEEAKNAHEKMFGRIGEEQSQAGVKTKTKKSETKLSSVVSRNGRITYTDDVEPEGTYPVPRARVAAVVYCAPAYEEVWGYATTDDDGYYTVNFNIPDGQTIFEMLVGIQVYSEYQAADICVLNESTSNPYMAETITNNGVYNYQIGVSAFTNPARVHWSIIQSYNMSSANGFGGGGVDVVLAPSDPRGGWYTTNLIHIWRYWDRNTTNFVSHEHGHHLMASGPGWPPYDNENCIDYTNCDPNTCMSLPWDEGWAEFWLNVVCKSVGRRVYWTPEIEENFDGSHPSCGSTQKSAYTVHCIANALWDLYDSSGSDEAYSYWSTMDDAFTGDIYNVYGYIANLKALNSAVIIEAIIQLNLPPSPGQLLLASAEKPPVIFPRAFSLKQNQPNPFNPSTSISFALPKECSNLSLTVFDVRGKTVKCLAAGRREAGNYTVFWNGEDESGSSVSSGVYFYRLVADSFNETRKMVLLK